MIHHAFIIAMIVLFLHACTWEGMIFEFVKKLVDSEKFISKPIYSCPICMTPWWGTIIYIIFIWSGSLSSWREYILIIFTASGISVFSVFGIYVMDYCKSRTRDKDECC